MGYNTDPALQALVQELERKYKIRNVITTEYLHEAVVYLRYSSHRQDGGVSLEYQINEALHYAEREKIRITGWYIDTAKTAKEIAGRDDFIRLFNDVKMGNVPPNLIVFATNRAFRNNFDSIQHRQILRDNGITLHSATQRIDEKTTAGRLNVNMLATIDQYKSEEISDFVSAATRYLITDGFFAGGISPFGYITETVIHNGKERVVVKPYEPEAAIVREMYAEVLAGRNLNQIAKAFNEKGYRTRKGNPFQWHTLRPMLSNIIYKGERLYKMQSGTQAYSNDYCPPIVSKEIFDKANILYEENKRKTKGRAGKTIYPLTGKIVCGDCGCSLVGNTSNKYSYYLCQAKHRNRECCTKRVQRAWLDELAFDAVKENILSDKAIADISKQVLAKIKKAPAGAKSKKELMSRQSTLEKEIAEIVQMKLNGEITTSVMAMMTAEKNAEITSISRKLGALNISTDTSIDAAYIKKRIRSILDQKTIIGECSGEMLKELFAQTIKQIEVSNTQVVIHLRIPLFDITHKHNHGNPELGLCVTMQR